MTLLEAARKDLGQEEKRGQYGFNDELFEAALIDVGWAPGWAWDSFLLEKWVRQAIPKRAAELNGFFVASAMATFRNLKNAGYTVSTVPVVGAFVFWQRIENGVPLWLGRAGIVSRVNSGIEFFAIEGDARQEGDECSAVLERLRAVRNIVHDGLKVVGFIEL